MRVVDARRALGVVTLACTLALTGCSPDRPAEPSPSPTPAVQTPSETAQERQERVDYAAAEKSYRTFRAEYNRMLRAGGAKEPTKLMKASAGGGYLSVLADVAWGFHFLGSYKRGRERIVYVRPSGYSPKSLVLDVCEDDRSLISVRDPGADTHGDLRVVRLTVRRVDGAWKVWDGDGKVVKTCE